ncbi:MAG: hypothetical protein ABI623_12785, partial [bacterium]
MKVTREETTATGTTVACVACGHLNSTRNIYCESCGAKLAGTVGVETVKKSKPSAKDSTTAKKSAQGSRFKFETWHYVLAAAVVAIAGYFIYDEVDRNSRLTPANVQTAPLNFPSQQAPSSPPTKEILDAIARLEATVKANPNDAGAKLLLANALHDGALHDGSLFPRAIIAYQNYLKEKPGDPNARVDLGICYFELGKIDSTRSDELFNKAIQE